MSDVMVDLETWGTYAGSAIRSVAALEFDLMGERIAHDTAFYMNVNTPSQTDLGLLMEQSTVDWWARQSAEAQQALEVEQQHILVVLDKLHSWFLSLNGSPFVWCQGANFDVVLLAEIYRRANRQTPWRFFNVRDTRTAYMLGGINDKQIPREGTAHNALDDCVHQARCVQRAAHALFGARMVQQMDHVQNFPKPHEGMFIR